MKAEMEALERTVFGKTGERMPPMDREGCRGKKADPAQRQATRRTNAELRVEKFETELVDIRVPDAQRHCPLRTAAVWVVGYSAVRLAPSSSTGTPATTR